MAEPKRPRTGGRQPGRACALADPNDYGTGVFPYEYFNSVHPAPLRAALAQWQDICLDVRERRVALGLHQREVAAQLSISVNSVQRIEPGEWVAAHILFRVAAVLGLEIWNAVEVRRNAPPSHRRRP